MSSVQLFVQPFVRAGSVKLHELQCFFFTLHADVFKFKSAEMEKKVKQSFFLALLTCQSAKLITLSNNWGSFVHPFVLSSLRLSFNRVAEIWGHWSLGFHIRSVNTFGECNKPY